MHSDSDLSAIDVNIIKEARETIGSAGRLAINGL